MNIVPVIRPNIEWQLLDAACGFNIRHKTDGSKRKWTEAAQLLVALSQEPNPARAMREAGPLAHSLLYGFLSDHNPKLGWTHIRTYPVRDNFISVGTLAEWHSAIVQTLLSFADKDLRQYLGTVLIYFEHEGLGDLFSEYTKHMQPDGTFVLR